MYLSGFADEAARDLAGQIRATRELGWECIEARSVNDVNLVDLDEAAFARTLDSLGEAGIRINCFGSTIANWGKPPTGDFSAELASVDRAIDRMRRSGTELIRIMSYAILEDGDGRPLPDQMEKERFRRLNEICRRFTGAGLTPVHENCHSYGGMSWSHTLRMLDNVAGMKLVFDTGNPVGLADYSREFPYPRQSAWEFYQKVQKHIVYVHIKDANWDEAQKEVVYCYPGEGEAEIKRIAGDLLSHGYDGGFSMEPHMVVVFHDAKAADREREEERFANYVAYGRKFMALLSDLGRPLAKGAS